MIDKFHVGDHLELGLSATIIQLVHKIRKHTIFQTSQYILVFFLHKCKHFFEDHTRLGELEVVKSIVNGGRMFLVKGVTNVEFSHG